MRTEPWLVESAIQLIANYLKPNHATLEFGSGGSTKWLANRCQWMVSFEHDPEWYEVVYSKVEKEMAANRLVYKLFDRPYSKYVETQNVEFDLILVDGRDRVKCVKSSIPKLKSGGWLVLDNSEREYYKPAIDLMSDWNQIHCIQNRPDKYDFTYPSWQTSIFIKP